MAIPRCSSASTHPCWASTKLLRDFWPTANWVPAVNVNDATTNPRTTAMAAAAASDAIKWPRPPGGGKRTLVVVAATRRRRCSRGAYDRARASATRSVPCRPVWTDSKSAYHPLLTVSTTVLTVASTTDLPQILTQQRVTTTSALPPCFRAENQAPVCASITRLTPPTCATYDMGIKPQMPSATTEIS